jgi:hypothetical protein
VIQPNITGLFDTQNPFDLASLVGGAYTNELSNITFFVEHLAGAQSNTHSHIRGKFRTILLRVVAIWGRGIIFAKTIMAVWIGCLG